MLLLQKPTKSHSRYDPDPYTVTDVHGTQITATRNGKVRKRDSTKFKKVTIKAPTNYAVLRQAGGTNTADAEDSDYDINSPPVPTQNRPTVTSNPQYPQNTHHNTMTPPPQGPHHSQEHPGLPTHPNQGHPESTTTPTNTL